MSDVGRDMRRELYLSLLLLGADPILLGASASWALELKEWEWLSTMSGEQLDAAQQRIAQTRARPAPWKKQASGARFVT